MRMTRISGKLGIQIPLSARDGPPYIVDLDLSVADGRSERAVPSQKAQIRQDGSTTRKDIGPVQGA